MRRSVSTVKLNVYETHFQRDRSDSHGQGHVRNTGALLVSTRQCFDPTVRGRLCRGRFAGDPKQGNYPVDIPKH